MSFTVKFYNISYPKNMVNKILTDKGVGNLSGYSCTPFEYVSDLHGRINLDYVQDIEGANYCQITDDGRLTDDGRYCYVTDIIKGTGQHMTVELEVDPLKTYSSDIGNCPIYVNRTSFAKPSGQDAIKTGYNAYLPDTQQPVLVPTQTDYIEMGEFKWGTDILITLA